MSSSDSFGSSMLFQTINEDLNASLATADELSREFNSLLQECSPSTDSAPQQSSNFRPQRVASASSTYSGGGSSGGRLSGGGSSGGGQFGGTPEREVRGGESSRGSSSLPTTPAGSMTLDLSQRSLDSLISDSRVRAVSPVAQRQLTPPMARHERPDPAYSYGQRTPPNQSPRMRRHRSPTADRSPRGSVSYGEPGASYDHQPNRNTLSPFAGPKTQLDVLHMGRRSPNKDRSSSPLSFNQSSANTLPRNFMHRPDEGVQRHISPAQWNESDLDVSYEKKPHHTYEKADWIRPSVPNSNWRESNLDSPPRKRKDVPLSHQGNFPNATLPRNARIAVPPQHTSVPPQHTSPSHSPYSPQPIISRISIPPSSVKQRQRRPIPLTVLMQLQNPYYGVARTRYPRGPETDPEMGQYRQLLPHGQPDMRLHHYREVLSSGDVDAEVERLDPHRLSTIREWSGNQRQGSGTHLEVDPGPAPRPLSPTRLQPVVAGGAEVVPDLEELLRIRAEIPRALKRRGSVDQHQPVKRFPGLQPDQYKQIISKLLRRKRHDHKGEPGSEGSAGSSSSSEGEENPNILFTPASPIQQRPSSPKPMGLNSILRRSSREHRSSGRRARLSPLVLLLDGALVGELDTVQRATQEMSDPSQPNDEGITAMHNAICGGHYSVVDFLVRIGANTSAPDSHGWTPLHCAASCNDKPMCEFLVRNGAAVMAVTESDGATAAQKCDPYAPGFEECESFLRDVEEAMGVENSGVLYALWGYPAQAPDELSFKEGDMVTILQKPEAVDWWWASLCGREGFVPNNYFGLFPKVRPKSLC